PPSSYLAGETAGQGFAPNATDMPGYELVPGDPLLGVEIAAEQQLLDAARAPDRAPSGIEAGEVPISPQHEAAHNELIADLAADMGISEVQATQGLTPGEVQRFGAELEVAVEALGADGIKPPVRRRQTGLSEPKVEGAPEASSVAAEQDTVDGGLARYSSEQALVEPPADASRSVRVEDRVEVPTSKPARRRWTGLDEASGRNADSEPGDTTTEVIPQPLAEEQVGAEIGPGDPQHNEEARIEFEAQAEKDATELVEGIKRLHSFNVWGDKPDQQLIARLDGLTRELPKGGYSIETAQEIVRVTGEYESYKKRAQGEHRTYVAKKLEKIPDAYLRELYFNPPNEDGANYLKTVIKNETGLAMESRSLQLRLLERIYGNETGGERWKQDELAQRVEGSFSSEMEKRIARLPEAPNPNESVEVSRYNYDLQCEAVTMLLDAGMKPEAAAEYMTAAAVRLRFDYNVQQTGSLIDVSRLRTELWRTNRALNKYGTDTLNRLHDKFGMENAWIYSNSELETLAALERGDPAKIEWLQKGDVTVLFTDARNDYNSVHVYGNHFTKDTGRTIRFELSGPGDIYRRMIFLGKLGIKPATFVHEAHGSPGSTQAGMAKGSDGHVQPAYITAFETDDETRIPIMQTQFGRLVRDYMQPNRGIDSDNENIGKKQIVLRTCSGDVPYESAGRKYYSIAEALARTIKEGDENTDIYAAREVMYTAKDNEGRVILGDFPRYTIDKSTVSAANKITVERRGGLMGTEPKTFIKRTRVKSISVRKTV
ncbi:hypothetical protein KA016_03840, partial [Candidatus Saccharibacteria bacterium]|nr:hypothetical protein [Candidatus Saccharibacteria bacterium]